MSIVIVERVDVTTEEVGEALHVGLGNGYTVLPGTAMNWNPAGGPRTDKPDIVTVGRGSTRLFRAEVTLSRRSEQTVLHVIAGGISPVLRLVNRFWIAERVRQVLQTSPTLQRPAAGSAPDQ